MSARASLDGQGRFLGFDPGTMKPKHSPRAHPLALEHSRALADLLPLDRDEENPLPVAHTEAEVLAAVMRLPPLAGAAVAAVVTTLKAASKETTSLRLEVHAATAKALLQHPALPALRDDLVPALVKLVGSLPQERLALYVQALSGMGGRRGHPVRFEANEFLDQVQPLLGRLAGSAGAFAATPFPFATDLSAPTGAAAFVLQSVADAADRILLGLAKLAGRT